jgi:hypothetical protein
VIDDQPETQRGVFRLADGAVSTFEIAHPEEVDEDMLNQADLVLVDYDLTDWPARSQSVHLGLRPGNGIALAAVLREHANKLPRPTGFAIHTGEAKQFSVTPAEPRAHLLARTHNLEWVFVKGQPDIVGPQADCLAAAIRKLPERWPTDNRAGIEFEVRELLALPKSDEEADAPSWAKAAMRDFAQCRAPLSEMVERNHGLLFVRWILHRILPYPCFLFDTHHLAVRLRVTHRSLISALEGGLRQWLESAAYRGVLAGFLGPRWWRAGVESLVWELGAGSMAAKRVHSKLSEAAGASLEPLSVSEPVVCIDQNYSALAEPRAGKDVVRIVPDDWPMYAGQAWTTVELAREHHRLAVIVAEPDAARLGEPKSDE